MNTDMTDLEWYRTRVNDGRGRLSAKIVRLRKAGYLTVKPTGMYTWVASITDKGRQALRSTADIR